MEEGIFRSGHLAMSENPVVRDVPAQAWGDLLTNRILVVAAVCLMLLFLLEFIRFAPTAVYCMKMARGSVNLEHSLGLARTRNILALVCVIPFCLVADRAGLMDFDFVPAMWKVPADIAVLAGYVLVRFILFKLCLGDSFSRTEDALAAHRTIFTFFIVLTALLLVTFGILNVSGAGAGLTGTVILWETALLYALSILRSGQILATDCNGFSTILYLCGLEAVPTGLLVASVLYL